MMADWWSSPLTRCTASPAIRVTSRRSARCSQPNNDRNTSRCQVLLPSIESMEKLHLTLPVPLNRLAAMFMPGAFSPIAEAEDDCSLATLRHDPTTGKATQGVRIPNSAVALRILRATGPLAATSANPFRRGKRTNGAGSRGRAGRCGGSVFGRGSDSGTCIVHGGCSRPARARRHRDSSGGSDSRAGHP